MSGINSGQSLGVLGVNVEVLGVDKVTTDLNKVERSFKKTTDTVKKTTNETKLHGAAQRRLSFVMLEASRGAEDFAIGFGINGIQGAIRGATNNIAQMGAIISPLVGTIVGFAGAGVAAIAVMVGMATRAKKAASGIDELTGALQRRNKVIEQGLRLQFDIADLVQGGDVTGSQRKLLDAQRLLVIEQRKLKGFVPEIGVGGLERDRQAKILEFGEKLAKEPGFFSFAGTKFAVRDILVEIAKQRDPEIADVGFPQDELSRREFIERQVRKDLIAGKIKPEEIERAFNSIRLPDSTKTKFKEFLKPVDKQINDITQDIKILEQSVRKFSNAVKDAEKSPAARAKRTKERNELAAKDAKEEDKRAKERSGLVGNLLDVLDPTSGKLRKIDERLKERREKIINFKIPGTDFPIPGAERQKLLDDAEQAATIERDKVLADRQKKIITAREKKFKDQQTKIFAANKAQISVAKSAIGFAESFLSPAQRRDIRFGETFRALGKLGLGTDEALEARFSLSRINRLEKEEDKIRARQGIAFSGVTEFSKVIQRSIGKRDKEKKIEEINKNQLIELKKIKTALNGTLVLKIK